MAGAQSPLDIPAELERIVREGKDTRSVLSALKELREMDGDTPPSTNPRPALPDAACPSCGAKPILEQPVVHERDGRFHLLADVTCPACGACLVDGSTEAWLVR